MKKLRIIIIGGGNMGAAMLQALLRVKGMSPKQVKVIEHNKVKRDQMKKRFLVAVHEQILAPQIRNADVVIVAVKPQDFFAVAVRISSNLPKHSLLVTIMAGAKIQAVSSATGCNRVIRIMPNLPMAVGQGFSAWFASQEVSKQQKIFIKKLLVAGGQQIQIHNEKMFDVITAISGSGPAYLFLFANNLMHAAQRLGVNKTLARKMVLQTLKGSLALLETSATSPAKWRERVTSKGGTTAAALEVLTKGQLNKLWLRAIRAAAHRSQQLTVFLDKDLRK
ncbi:MAG: Pyrroline-5-carboxylate reductase [candidate division CPR1 bacterium GW2011_GWA2_42_17]|uniref:Pyrroline-5-carboxylate reductase n=1 Tax=candidate division CPR1 bacterium GW2011_GWA2_42_17 TaxID=1618341 RepID=A0A0G0Z6A3_9BACT|nr:MAG: Pyrroline-5-carboxylate reductase [candidate division CPR1 bacterium GW2011_GWA2_42_17]